MRAALTICALAAFGAPAVAWEQPALGKAAKGRPGLLLTFDDGPHSTHTVSIMNTLDAHGIQAVFFWVGHRIDGHTLSAERADIALIAQRRGHLVANHTVNHANLCAVDSRKAEWEIDENAKRYHELLGLQPILFRAPYGADCRRLREQLKERGLAHLHWDLDPQEWKHHNADATLRYLKREIGRIDGRLVILLHDTHLTSVTVVPLLIEWVAQENERRQEQGLPTIEWISPSALLVEQGAAPAATWLGRFAGSEGASVAAAVSRLL